METAGSPETPETAYKHARCHNRGYHNLNFTAKKISNQFSVMPTFLLCSYLRLKGLTTTKTIETCLKFLTRFNNEKFLGLISFLPSS
jgi:hypothetical protein